MGTWNFSGDHNTPHKAVFCMWEDHDAYKEEMRQEYDEETLENMMGMDDQFGYSDWYDSEKEYYMEMLAEDLKEAFGHKIDVDGKARDGQKVCTIGEASTSPESTFHSQSESSLSLVTTRASRSIGRSPRSSTASITTSSPTSPRTSSITSPSGHVGIGTTPIVLLQVWPRCLLQSS